MQQPWFVLESGPGKPASNMAWDEALLEWVSVLGKPVLRFYGWTEPAASFGYFQKFREIEAMTKLRPLVRRPTGGGLVPHNADWTYSLVFPPTHDWYSLSAVVTYRQVHEWIQTAFAQIGVNTELAAVGHPEPQAACFSGWEKNDLVWRGQKMAGAAQRRRRDGLLIQGSVQPSGRMLSQRKEWEQAMCDAARSLLGTDWERIELNDDVAARARDLAQRKYSTAAYNEKR